MAKEIINRKPHVCMYESIGRHSYISVVHNIAFQFRHLKETTKMLTHGQALL